MPSTPTDWQQVVNNLARSLASLRATVARLKQEREATLKEALAEADRQTKLRIIKAKIEQL